MLNNFAHIFFSRIFIVLLVCLVVAVSVIVVRPKIAARAAGPTIKLNITFGPPSALVNVNGTGFGISEQINLSFDANSIASTNTDASGSFSNTITIPNSALPGNHTLSATGVTSGAMVQRTFLVQTSWPEFGYSTWHSHYNPHENVINATNVSSLVVASGWPVKAGNVINSSPAVNNGSIYVGSCDKKLYAFNATTGAQQWATATGGCITFSSPAEANGIVYIGSFDQKLYAIDFKTGNILWTGQTGNNISSSPVIANNIVYVGSLDGNLYAFNATSGASLWSVATSGLIVASPALVNGIVYISSEDGKLYAISVQTGATLWTAATGNQIVSSPTIANGVAYVGSTDHNLYAFDASSGAQLWSYTTGGAIISSPTVVNGVLYVGSQDTKLYAFTLPGS